MAWLQTGEWFALTVKPQHEKAVTEALGILGVEAFVPLYRAARDWPERLKVSEQPLFPGYVLARVEPEARLDVLRIPGVLRYVSFCGKPLVIEAAQIETLRRVLDSDLRYKPWPYAKRGERIRAESVRIERGSLKGVEGLLQRDKDRLHLVLDLEVLERSVAVELTADLILPLRAFAARA